MNTEERLRKQSLFFNAGTRVLLCLYMLSATLQKFLYPESLVKEYQYWYLLCRFEQVTLGSLILIHKGEEDAFSKIPAAAFTELATIVPEVETTLSALFQNDKINYLMLMMTDPEVHFHVIPRYATPREFEGMIFTDAAWPKKIDIGVKNDVSREALTSITAKLRQWFPK